MYDPAKPAPGASARQATPPGSPDHAAALAPFGALTTTRRCPHAAHALEQPNASRSPPRSESPARPPTPALAAETPRLDGHFAEAKIAAWAKAVDVKPPDPGPFVPVAGSFDYGTAENAFGAARSGHTHAGQDMMAAAGTPLVAVDDAVVAETGSDGGQGNYVHLYDREARSHVRLHAHDRAGERSRSGDRVEAGERARRASAAPARAGATTSTSRSATAAGSQARRTIRCPS